MSSETVPFVDESSETPCAATTEFCYKPQGSCFKEDVSLTKMGGMACMKEMRNAGRAEGPATILAIGTAVPPNCYPQSEYVDFYFRVTNSEHLTGLKEKFQNISDKSSIKKRYLFPTEEILKKNPNMCEFNAPSLDARQEMLLKEIPRLGMEAAVKAIEEWGQDKSKITHLIFCTTGSVETPSADFRLAKLLGLNPSVNRVMVYMQGCFAGGTALRIAKDLAENNQDARVLVVCSETIGFCFRGPSEEHIDSLVGQILFSDGASALVVGSDPKTTSMERPIFELVSANQTIIPDTEGAVSLHVQESGLNVHLSRKIPTFIGSHIGKIVHDAFEPLGIKDWNSIFWAAHPGGRAILDQIEDKLCLTKDKMRASRHVLSEYGNMIGACVFFILDEIRRKSNVDAMATTGEGFDWGVLLGFGPGITVETVVLRSVPI